MYLKKTPTNNGRIRLSIVDSYYDKKKKCSRQTTVESLGFLDDLEKDSITRKNIGYAPLSTIYHTLGIDTFLANRQRHSKMEYNANHIMELLVYSRLLYPHSKKKTYESRENFFIKTNYSLDDIYRFLTFISKYEEDLQQSLNEQVKLHYQRDTSIIYYDVTNYYFETDNITDFKRKGVSKEHRPNPIVQMGLFMDNNGLPITYELFSGNTNDWCLTYRPNFGRIKKNYNFGRVISVAEFRLYSFIPIPYHLLH